MKTTLDLRLLYRTKRFRDASVISTVDMYELYPYQHLHTKKEFDFLLKVYNRILIEYLILTGNVVKLPRRLGTISIRTTDPKAKRIDYGYFRKTGEIVYHNNIDAPLMRFFWDKRAPRCLSPNKTLFSFKPCAQAKGKFGSYINETNSSYKYLPIKFKP